MMRRAFILLVVVFATGCTSRSFPAEPESVIEGSWASLYTGHYRGEVPPALTLYRSGHFHWSAVSAVVVTTKDRGCYVRPNPVSLSGRYHRFGSELLLIPTPSPLPPSEHDLEARQHFGDFLGFEGVPSELPYRLHVSLLVGDATIVSPTMWPVARGAVLRRRHRGA